MNVIKNLSILSIAFSALIFSGCTSAYTQFYKEFSYTPSLRNSNDKNILFLQDGQTPKIYTTDNINRDVRIMMSKRYRPIGESSFNGEFEDEQSIINHAKKIKAVAALYTWKYINTQTTSGSLTLPQTNYFSGTVNGSNGFSTFNGSSTGMVSTPYSFTQRRYDQHAVFFVQYLKTEKFGIIPKDIERDLKIKIGHSGIMIDNIFEDSPAYKSNLLIGDIVIEVDNKKIDTLENFNKILRDIDNSVTYSDWKVIRNNEEKVIRITL